MTASLCIKSAPRFVFGLRAEMSPSTAEFTLLWTVDDKSAFFGVCRRLAARGVVLEHGPGASGVNGSWGRRCAMRNAYTPLSVQYAYA